MSQQICPNGRCAVKSYMLEGSGSGDFLRKGDSSMCIPCGANPARNRETAQIKCHQEEAKECQQASSTAKMDGLPNNLFKE